MREGGEKGIREATAKTKVHLKGLGTTNIEEIS